jgi:hypothetical protein
MAEERSQVYAQMRMNEGEIKSTTVVGVNRADTLKRAEQVFRGYLCPHQLDKPVIKAIAEKDAVTFPLE